ncbi:MAG: hypothetical protein ORN98_00955 [Alphaproteobacteria bacterium]|nr:hypothetical protein [Alphaproteobacteria bacterium]
MIDKIIGLGGLAIGAAMVAAFLAYAIYNIALLVISDGVIAGLICLVAVTVIIVAILLMMGAFQIVFDNFLGRRRRR